MPADTSLMTTPDGRQLEYRVTGRLDGPAVLFHTGTPGATADFSGVTGAASAAGVRLIGYSRPGYGRSTERPGRSVADVVEDSVALLDELGVHEFRTLGWSGGGPHALACAALLPGRCKAAALLASVAPYGARGLDWLDGMDQSNVEEFTATLAGVDELVAHLQPDVEGLANISGAELAEGMGGLLSSVDKAAVTGTPLRRARVRVPRRRRERRRRLARRRPGVRTGLGLRALGHHDPGRRLAGPPGPHGAVRPRRVARGRDPERPGAPVRGRGPRLADRADRQDPRRPGHPRRLTRRTAPGTRGDRVQRMGSDVFGARASLPGMPDLFRINRLDESGAADTQRLPHTVRILLEGLLRNAGGLHVREEDVLALAGWPAAPGEGKRVPFFPARVLLQDFTGVPAVVDLAAMRAAMARAGRDPSRVDPLGALRPRDRPLGAGRRGRHAAGLRAQHRARVRAQRRALPAAALGPGRLRLVPRRAARHGDRAPGQPRASRARRGNPRRRRRARHAGRHRLAHDDDQRPRRARLRRRRHRGRGGHAGRAARARHALGRRRAHGRRAARGRDRDRPRADADRAAAARTASSGASSSSAATASRRSRSPTARRSPTCRPSTAPPPRSSPSTTRCSATCAPRAATTLVPLVDTVTQGAGPVPARRRSDARLQHAGRARPRRRRPEPGRPAPPAGPRAAGRRARQLPRGLSAARESPTASSCTTAAS